LVGSEFFVKRLIFRGKNRFAVNLMDWGSGNYLFIADSLPTCFFQTAASARGVKTLQNRIEPNQ